MKLLPDYAPPELLRANVAVGTAPLLVLAVFATVVWRLMDADTGFAVLAACCVWVAVEMRAYQKAVDAYNRGYVEAHLAWRSLGALAALARCEHQTPATREFVQHFLDGGCAWRADGPRLH